jgi:hypothetical protein
MRIRDASNLGIGNAPPLCRTVPSCPHPHSRPDAKANGVKFGRKPILTPHQKKEAPKRLKAGETQRSVARSYNVSQSTFHGSKAELLLSSTPAANFRLPQRLRKDNITPNGPEIWGMADGRSPARNLQSVIPGIEIWRARKTESGAANAFVRGGQDGQNLSLTVAPLPLNEGEVIAAFYGAGSLGIDLTTKLISYLADPGNSRQIVIGSAAFFTTFCGGNDPASGTTKYFSVTLGTPDSEVINQCGYDGQTVDLTLPADPNPLIVVNSALYGAPGIAAVDVTAKTQALFDLQYQANPQLLAFTLADISPALFNIPDPATGQTKTLTIAYSIPGAGAGDVFYRGGQDAQNLALVATPLNSVEVVRAFYGTGGLGIDLIAKLISYLADPGNSRQIVIGNAAFFTIFCGGNDPAPRISKYFSVTLKKSGYAINQCGYDGQSVDLTGPANQSWMTDMANSTPGFGDLTVSQICWPVAHDSGTYSLGSTFTTNVPGWIKAVMDIIQKVTDAIDVIPLISKVIDPLDWVKSGVLDDTRALATSTHSDIRQQLNDGIRYLDLRVYYNHADPISPFYTFHALTGVRIETILDEVAYFISVVAPAGEIIYITMAQYWDDNTGDHGFTGAQMEQLAALVWKCFDKSQAFGPSDGGELLGCTYSNIIASGGSNRSKVILVMQPFNGGVLP